jgi:hypothetical protein
MLYLSARRLTLCFTGALLLGCTTVPPDPPRNYVGKSNDAILVVRSTDMPMGVEFSVSASAKACDGFESIGVVRDSGRGVLLPWIARLTDRLSSAPVERRASIPAGQVVQVKGYGSWRDSAGSGYCGPLVAKFPVVSGSTYLVEFVWKGTSACSIRVADTSVAGDVRPVPFERGVCPRPSVFGF